MARNETYFLKVYMNEESLFGILAGEVFFVFSVKIVDKDGLQM